MSICWLDGKLVSADQATVSVFDHGLLYGDGVFEGIRFYAHKAFRMDAHLKRLNHSARAIGLTLPYTLQQLETAINDVIQAFAEPDGYLRLVITRGRGPLGVDPRTCKRGTTFIIADRLSFVSPQVQNSGANLIIASTRRLPPDGLDPRVKSLNYLNHVLAKMEANRAGADEAILLNAQGNVTEGTTDNIFIIREQQLFTPPVSDGALDGITRDIVLELVKELGIPGCERTLSPYDLYTADECFLTGTAVELIPVREIDARVLPLCPGPVFQRIQNAFGERIRRDTESAIS